MASTANERFDLTDSTTRARLLPHCRLRSGDIWQDPVRGHVVGCGDAADRSFIHALCESVPPATLALHDPPYNMVMGEKRSPEAFADWCRQWVAHSYAYMAENSSLYIWLGADQNNHFQPLPQFMLMMAQTAFASRSFITMRNQRGYGTQSNWMAVRQELLYYTKGQPLFKVQYTDIPKILRGYYKEVNGERTENLERSRSDTIRAGNVWVDVQQVFYRMEENVAGCYAQKPLKAIERILLASSHEGDTVLDFFAHAGTTLLAAERLGRRCVTCDIDPIFAELSIRRLEHFRETGRMGWGRSRPFELHLTHLRKKKLGPPMIVAAER
ncbi:site-specific DNA-methyltransferase [bacterium]|nr:site-specific DNA-methyltransferase [bacterium]